MGCFFLFIVDRLYFIHSSGSFNLYKMYTYEERWVGICTSCHILVPSIPITDQMWASPFLFGEFIKIYGLGIFFSLKKITLIIK